MLWLICCSCQQHAITQLLWPGAWARKADLPSADRCYRLVLRCTARNTIRSLLYTTASHEQQLQHTALLQRPCPVLTLHNKACTHQTRFKCLNAFGSWRLIILRRIMEPVRADDELLMVCLLLGPVATGCCMPGSCSTGEMRFYLSCGFDVDSCEAPASVRHGFASEWLQESTGEAGP